MKKNLLSQGKTSWVRRLLALGGVMGTAFVALGYDVRIETPTVWYSFDSEAKATKYRSLGWTGLTFSANNGGNPLEASPNGQALGGTIIVYGSAFPYGSGDWTTVTRIKARPVSATSVNYPVLWSYGRMVDANLDNFGLYMDGKTAGRMRWAMACNKNFTTGQIIDFDVPTANTAYHTYAAIYRAARKQVDVYCDGVKVGTLDWKTCSSSNANWCWYTNSGANAVGSGAALNSPMDDFRHYQRALSDEELVLLHNMLDAGHVYGGPLGTTSRLVWQNVQLADVKKFQALTYSKSFNVNAGDLCKPWTAHVLSNDGTTANVQFQYGSIRWVRVTFTQQGNDVWANIQPNGIGYGSFEPGVDVTTRPATATWPDPFASDYYYNVVGLTFDTVSRADEESRFTWYAAEGAPASAIGNYRQYWNTPADLAAAKLYFPYADGLRHTVAARNRCLGGDVAIDGNYAFTEGGGFSWASLGLGATARLEYDPSAVSVHLATAPTIAEGAKFALPAKYAAATKGRLQVMSWDAGTFPVERLADFFDATSCAAAAPVLTVESNSLWLTLDPDWQPPKVSVLAVGDSITDGVGAEPRPNWRLPLMKKLTALGYEPTALGFRTNNHTDASGVDAPEAWRAHSGVGGQFAHTSAAQGGVVDTICPYLEQAGVPDVAVLLFGYNDINGSNYTGEQLYNVWKETLDRAIAYRPTTKFVCGSVIPNVSSGFAAAKKTAIQDFRARMMAQIAKAPGEPGAFPANQVYLADTYQAIPQTTGSYSSDGCHPDWYGHTVMADCFATAITNALAAPRPEGTVATNLLAGAKANVPAAYREGFKLCRTLHLAETGNFTMDVLPTYDPVDETMDGATANISRVGYYVELRRKGRAHRRFVWADMDAFGARNLATVGVPTMSDTAFQGLATRLHVYSNDPGVDNVDATDNTVSAWLEFWPETSENRACGLPGSPQKTFTTGLDWNDSRGTNPRGSMQVHRLCAEGPFAAKTVFAFNAFATGRNDPYEIGLGIFPQQYYAVEQNLIDGHYTDSYRSIDWTWTQNTPTLSSRAYDEIVIEIWTKAAADETDVAYDAWWTGAVDADVTNPGNWACTNVFGSVVSGKTPQGFSRVRLGGPVALDIPEGAPFAYAMLEFTKTVTLQADCDWRGFDLADVQTGGVIDLNGHKLFVRGYNGTSAVAFTVTDSATGGELHVDVAEGETFVNEAIALTGNLKLVKDGAGTFIAMKKAQLYRGGTEIAAGKMRNGFASSMGDNPFGGSGLTVNGAISVVVHTGATLDLNGSYWWGYHTITLDGGTLYDATGYVSGKHFNPVLKLTADSFLAIAGNGNYSLYFEGVLDLQGHRLTVTIPVGTNFLRWRGQPMTCSGTFDVASGGGFTTELPFNAPNVDFRMGAAFQPTAPLTVKGYDAVFNGGDYNTGSTNLVVNGVFKPTSPNFYGCTMANGSTIDISDKTAVWTTSGTSAKSRNTVDFVDGATVAIDLGTRAVPQAWTYFVTWKEPPKNLSTLKFKVKGKYGAVSIAVGDEKGVRILRQNQIIFFR